MSFDEEGLTPMADVQGTCDARFEPVRDALAAQLESGEELGASIAVDVDGQTGRRHLGRLVRRRADQAVGRGHDHQRLVDDQDGHQPRRPDAGRPGALDRTRR